MKTGYYELDNVMKLDNGQLIVVVSRPAMGKSTFAINIATNVAINNIPVAIFNLEMSKEQVISKILCSKAMVDSNRLRTGQLDEQDWLKLAPATESLSEAPIYIDDTPNIIIEDICKKSKDLKVNKNISLLIIDYLQLIGFDKSKLLSRDEELKENLKKLKGLAKELDIPIIITSQLSRKCEGREDKRPLITDFGNSKYGINTYSDKILFLYRASYYNQNIEDNATEVIIAKNSDGKCDTVKLGFFQKY